MEMALTSVSMQLQTQFIDWVFNIDREERLAALLVGCDGLGSELVTTEHSQGFLGLSVTLGHTPGVDGAIGDESLNVGLGGSLDGQATSGSPSSKSKSVKVIVVGAGPSGLLLALLLANAGINVQVLEAASKLDDSPRATHYSWPAIYELKRAGLLDEVRERGFVTWGGIQWRDLEGNLLARFNPDAIATDYRLHCFPLGELCSLIKEHLDRRPKAEVKYLHKVLKVDQVQEHAQVWAETPDGEQKFEADYIVGCDGASSKIRTALFGDEFPGRTWDEQIVATNVYYNIERHGWDQGAFIVDPNHWSMALQISLDGMLRVTYGEVPGLTREQYLARLPEKYRTILPGHPSPEDYKVVNFSPYKIHQRCAKSFRVGRILLAADAAHLCNPFGGLGLTGGIVDVGNLFDCLNGIHQGLVSERILDRYSEVRREKYFTIIDPVSSSNLRRLIQEPDVAMKEDDLFKMADRFQDADFCAQLSLGVNSIMHDFTQEYDIRGEASAKLTTS